MAEITRRRTGEFVRKLFELLMEHPDGLQAGEALSKLVSFFTLSEYEAGSYEGSGVRRFDKIVRFATVDCVKAGWLTKHKGTWFLTPEGRAAHNKFKDPEAFYKEAVRLYREWKAARTDGDTDAAPVSPDDAADKSAQVTFDQANEQAWAQIEDYLRKMPPYDFQELVADLLTAMDYHIYWVSPPGKDGGIDIIAFTDPLGTKGPRVKVQVKRRGEKVTTEALNAFLATINENEAGLYVSAAGYTRDAMELARKDRRKITLMHLQGLVELWIEHQDKLSDEAHRRLPLTPIYFLTPET